MLTVKSVDVTATLQNAVEGGALVELTLKDGFILVPRGEIWAEIMEWKGEEWKQLQPHYECHYQGFLLQPYMIRKVYGKPTLVTDDKVFVRGIEAIARYIGTHDPFVTVPLNALEGVEVYTKEPQD